MTAFGRAGCLFLIALLAWSGSNLSVGAERTNLNDVETALIAYHDDGTYDRELREVATRVIARLREQAPKVMMPALVLDIDETSLSNWPRLRANQFAFFPTGPCDHLPNGPCGEDTWENLGLDAPLGPTLDIYRVALSLGVEVFFITGRKDAFQSATEQNLRVAGYSVWKQVIMRSDKPPFFSSVGDFKRSAREQIEKAHYTIVANVGDQESDLAEDPKGSHSNRNFKLPNPFYFIP